MAGFELTPEEIKLFLEEADEQLQLMEECLITLEENPNNPETIQEIFRAAHTLKGGAATAGYDDVAALTHAMESLLDLVRQGKTGMSSEFTDRLLIGVDALREALAAIDEHGAPNSLNLSGVTQMIEQMINSQFSDDNTGDDSEAGEADERKKATKDTHPALRMDSSTESDTWHLIVRISPNALMPAVRAYQAVLTLEDHVDVIKTVPSRTDIEQEVADVRELIVTMPGTDSEGLFEHLRTLVLDIPDIVAVEKTTPTLSEVPKNNLSGMNVSVNELGQTIRVNVQLLDALMNLVGELVIDRTRLAQLASDEIDVEQLQKELAQLSGRLSRITTDLQENIMNARMMPIDTLFKRFPRMIRDISRQLGKPIEFTMTGQETELDRSVIEQIGDPLIHLLRNAADHGIEPVEERRRLGKSETGHIGLRAYHQENHIHIEVFDDGRGIDLDLLKKRAIEKGILSVEDADRVSSRESAELIFAPGISTAGSVSSLSGRGVGMDVVKRNIERVNGVVSVDTEKGKGTKVSIKLPLTLAILQALMVEIAGQTFAVPLSNVTEAVQISGDAIRRVRGWEMITVREELTPLLNPEAVWGERWRVGEGVSSSFPVVVLRSGSFPIGLKVDRLLGEEEIVIKTLGSVVGDVLGISGASILGDGRVALIIDPVTLGTAIKQDGYDVHDVHLEVI